MPRRRNPYVTLPIMRKGGAHVKSRTGQRVHDRQALEDEVDDYLEEMEKTNEQEDMDNG